MIAAGQSHTIDSPRPGERPYSFTVTEFIVGAFWAWLLFQPLAALAALIEGAAAIGAGVSLDLGYVVMALLITLWGIVMSLFIAMIASLPAVFLGLLLRRQSRFGLHLLTFGVYGGLVGLVAVLLVFGTGADLWAPLPIGCIAASTSATILGRIMADRYHRSRSVALFADESGADANLESWFA